MLKYLPYTCNMKNRNKKSGPEGNFGGTTDDKNWYSHFHFCLGSKERLRALGLLLTTSKEIHDMSRNRMKRSGTTILRQVYSLWQLLVGGYYGYGRIDQKIVALIFFIGRPNNLKNYSISDSSFYKGCSPTTT